VSFQAILFDLDGTLADTAVGLGLALNMQRERHGLAPLAAEIIRPYASHGTPGLLGVGFGLSKEAARFGEMRAEYLTLYDEVFLQNPQLFEDVAEVLDAIEVRGLKWGVVTNKPSRFTVPLMQALGLAQRATCIVSGDDCERPKPHPYTLLLASQLADIAPQQCVYVGDAERDIIAGHAAGMSTIVAMYGYLDAQDKPETWGAQSMIATPVALLPLI